MFETDRLDNHMIQALVRKLILDECFARNLCPETSELIGSYLAWMRNGLYHLGRRTYRNYRCSNCNNFRANIWFYISAHEAHHFGIGELPEKVQSIIRSTCNEFTSMTIDEMAQELRHTNKAITEIQIAEVAEMMEQHHKDLTYESIQREIEADVAAVLAGLERMGWYAYEEILTIAVLKMVTDQLISSTGAFVSQKYHYKSWSTDKRHWELRVRNNVLFRSLYPIFMDAGYYHAAIAVKEFSFTVHSTFNPVFEVLSKLLPISCDLIKFRQADCASSLSDMRDWLTQEDILEDCIQHYSLDECQPELWEQVRPSNLDMAIYKGQT